MEIKEEIRKILLSVINRKWPDFGFSEDDIEIGHPDSQFGDYSSNIALKISSKLGKNAIEIAEEILVEISVTSQDFFEKVSFAGPGFINFSLSKGYFSKIVGDILNLNEKWGEIGILRNKQYLIEHSSPNLFKPFHIGHLVNNSIGESLSRIIEKSGAELVVTSFPSDISPGIAKTVWAIIKNKWKKDDLTIEKIGEAYVLGTKEYNENEKSKKEMDSINEILYLKNSSVELEIYEKGKNISLDYFKKITTRLGSVFDDLIFESEAEMVGKEIVKNNMPNIFRESDGAVIFPGSEYGLFDNVFINSQGFGTYLAKDLGLLKIKFDRFEFDKSITITDIEQKDHFKLVKKVAELLSKEWFEKSEYIQHGRLTFSGTKTSSRLGNVPLAENLIELAKNKVLDKIKEQDFPEKEKIEIAEKVAISALKYSILKCSAGKNIIFDIEKAIAFEGDTGPYLQYALVRTNSILKNIEQADFFDKNAFKERKGEIPLVEKMLLKFPSTINDALRDNSPHHIANYLYNLASEFGSFYSHTKILDFDNPDFKNNLALTKAIQITLKNGLDLLGIESLDRM